jgi:hypothetical protein
MNRIALLQADSFQVAGPDSTPATKKTILRMRESVSSEKVKK